MAKIVGVTSCPTGIAHSLMAAEALKKTAALLGHEMRVEVHGAEGTKDRLTDEEIDAADAVILAADIHVGVERFAGKPITEVSTSRAIRQTEAVMAETLARVPGAAMPTPPPAGPSRRGRCGAGDAGRPTKGKRIVAITACPTGIAHTFMAAKALTTAATSGGHEIKVETQGSVGAKNQLTDEEIDKADVVIIAADTHVDLARFAGKPLYQTSVGAAVKQAPTRARCSVGAAGRPGRGAGRSQGSFRRRAEDGRRDAPAPTSTCSPASPTCCRSSSPAA